MSTLTISIPDSLSDHLEKVVAKGGFDSANEYVVALIRENREGLVGEGVEAPLVAGLDSGVPLEVDDEFWATKRRRLTA